MYDDDIVGGSAWVMERHGWKEIVIIVSLDHFAQVTNKLDLLLPPRISFWKDLQKPFLLKCLYCASNNQLSNNQPIAILRELIVYFISLSDKCD